MLLPVQLGSRFCQSGPRPTCHDGHRDYVHRQSCEKEFSSRVGTIESACNNDADCSRVARPEVPRGRKALCRIFRRYGFSAVVRAVRRQLQMRFFIMPYRVTDRRSCRMSCRRCRPQGSTIMFHSVATAMTLPRTYEKRRTPSQA